MRALPLLMIVILLSGCSVSHYLRKEIRNSPVLAQQHTGVSISRLNERKPLARYQDDKYFTPASNTKLFTFYAGLCALKDSVPGLEYLEWGDLLIIRGTGDPSLLHPDLPESNVLQFLKSRTEPTFFTPYNFENKRFGPGWAWSDYNDYYQPEVTAMPIYGNIARFRAGINEPWSVSPAIWNSAMLADTSVRGIKRDELQNTFHYPKKMPDKKQEVDVPVHMSDALTVQLLSHALKKEIKLIKIPLEIELKTVYSIPSDSLYRRMMQVSDNMLAEQLMLLYASANGLPLNTEKAIAHMIENHLKDMPDKLIWKDGSGLSRYNLFTPRSIVALLQKIHQKLPQDRLFTILPTGGKNGTLSNLFKNSEPFVYAKTGSLSNNFSLSGYLITKKKKTLVFSFMNGNFTRPASEIRKEVERILTDIHNRY